MTNKEPFFLGIELPASLNRQVEGLQQKVHSYADLLAPLPPHITLVPPSCAATVERSVFLDHARQVSANTKPPIVTLVDFGVFGDRSFHLQAERASFSPLHENITEMFPGEVQNRYYASPTRQFNPHVTLAQARPGEKLPGDIVAECIMWSTELIPVSFTPDHLTVFVNQGGRNYVPQEQILLAKEVPL